VKEFRLKSYEFRREREAVWRELELLVDQVEADGLGSLSPEQVARLPEAYRATLSSASVAKAISLDVNLIAYLEGLSRRAYVAVYASHRRMEGALLEFFRRGFAGLAWAARREIVTALILLCVGGASGFVLTRSEPDRYYRFVPDGLAVERGPLSTREELLESIRTESGDHATLGAFSSMLFVHNAGIGLLCFTLGVAAGVPVILLVFLNGLTLGSFVAIHAPHGLVPQVLAWIAPHGVTELLAVCVCAAGGLQVGQSLVFPGRYRRIDALVIASRRAGALVGGAVAMFVVAALLEGFFRQIVTDDAPRAAAGLVTAGFWFWYIALWGRRHPA